MYSPVRNHVEKLTMAMALQSIYLCLEACNINIYKYKDFNSNFQIKENPLETMTVSNTCPNPGR